MHGANAFFRIGPELRQIHVVLLRRLVEAELADRAQRGRRHLQPHLAVELGGEEALRLQVDLLPALVVVVRERDAVGVVGALPGDVADAAHLQGGGRAGRRGRGAGAWPGARILAQSAPRGRRGSVCGAVGRPAARRGAEAGAPPGGGRQRERGREIAHSRGRAGGGAPRQRAHARRPSTWRPASARRQRHCRARAAAAPGGVTSWRASSSRAGALEIELAVSRAA